MNLAHGARRLLWRGLFLLVLPVVPGLLGYVLYFHYTTPVLEFFQKSDQDPTIQYVVPGSQTDFSGIAVGDRVLAIDGQSPAAWQPPPAGQLARVAVDRNGQRLVFFVPTIWFLQLTYAYFLVAAVVVLTFWGCALVLALHSAQENDVKILFALYNAIAVSLISPLTSPWSFPTWLVLISDRCTYLAMPLLLHYAITFPAHLGSARARRIVLALGYGLALLCFSPIWQAKYFYVFFMIFGAMAAMAYSYIRRATPDHRRRLRLVMAGNLAAGAPTLLFYLLPTFFQLSFRMPEWLLGVALVLMPLSYFYAAAKNNLFGIDRLLNRALVILLLSLVLLCLSIVPLILLLLLLPESVRYEPWILAGTAFLVGLSFNWTRGLVQRGVDRIFYGGWYDYPGVVEALSNDLAHCLNRQELKEALTRRVPALMQLQSAEMWIGEPGELPTLPSRDSAAQFPLRFQNHVQAFWIAGARREGDALSDADLRILRTLAHQAEAALGNVLLVERLQRQLVEIRASRETITQAQHDLLRSREEERSRLARELHDGPIQSLVAMNMQLGLSMPASGQASGEMTAAIADMRAEIKTLLSDLREVCAELRPPMLDTLGLGAALRGLAEDWSAQSGIPIRWELPEDAALRGLPSEVSVNFYRIAQEGLANIAHHTRANQVNLSITCERGALSLLLQDDGQGFDFSPGTLQELAQRGHFGILGIHERAALIGAQIALESKRPKGTTLRVVWPQKSQEQ
jgi:signal transduction histidine kinase